jgi:NAD(P)-dependent dehydrogenase (short-subunit alcohol dehydrogenase family)
MSKSILVCGLGPGVSLAVAERFGSAGFAVGLVGRNRERLEGAVKALGAKGVKAHALPGDLADLAAVPALIESARKAIGPITVLQWSAYATGAGDLLKADPKELDAVVGFATSGLLATIRAALPDLRAQKGASAVLVTNGGLGYFDPNMDKIAVEWGAMGLGIANAAKHKLVGMLSHRLAADGIYVGEVVINGTVKGTAFDGGNATLEPAAVAGKFWELYSARTPVSVSFG